MKQGTKRIIAREGLIIIALCIASVTMISIHDLQRIGKFGNELPDAYVQLPKIYVGIEDSKHIVLFPKGTDGKIICEALTRDFATKCRTVVQLEDTDVNSDLQPLSVRSITDPSDVTFFARPSGSFTDALGIPYDGNGHRVEMKLIYRISFISFFIFFSLIAYPSYWLVRFIVWAVKIIRTKEEIK
ncbi:MAG: hypothetical protein ACLPN1_02480 [Dissulfurispiraceae bacterium]